MDKCKDEDEDKDKDEDKDIHDSKDKDKEESLGYDAVDMTVDVDGDDVIEEQWRREEAALGLGKGSTEDGDMQAHRVEPVLMSLQSPSQQLPQPLQLPQLQPPQQPLSVPSPLVPSSSSSSAIIERQQQQAAAVEGDKDEEEQEEEAQETATAAQAEAAAQAQAAEGEDEGAIQAAATAAAGDLAAQQAADAAERQLMRSGLLAYEQRLARLLHEQGLATERLSVQSNLLAMAAQDTCE